MGIATDLTAQSWVVSAGFREKSRKLCTEVSRWAADLVAYCWVVSAGFRGLSRRLYPIVN